MSLIPKILDILEAEVNRHLEQSPHELREFIGALDALGLSRLLEGINQRLRTKIQTHSTSTAGRDHPAFYWS